MWHSFRKWAKCVSRSLSLRGSVTFDVLFLRAKGVCGFCPRGRDNNNYYDDYYYCFKFTSNTVFSWLQSPRGLWPLRYRGFTIILRYISPTRTPLDEWSAYRRELYLTTHINYKRQTWPGRIRNHNPSKREAAEPRFIQHGRQFRLWYKNLSYIITDSNNRWKSAGSPSTPIFLSTKIRLLANYFCPKEIPYNNKTRGTDTVPSIAV